MIIHFAKAHIVWIKNKHVGRPSTLFVMLEHLGNGVFNVSGEVEVVRIHVGNDIPFTVLAEYISFLSNRASIHFDVSNGER